MLMRWGPRLAILATAVLLAACGPGSSPSPSVGSVAPSPSLDATIGPSAGRTFPPSQTPIDPGTYVWSGFERDISVELGAGWDLGHDNPAFFDLFRGSDFPSVSFARFSDVYSDAATRRPATDASAVVAALAGRADVTLTGRAAIQLAGLSGEQFDVVTQAAKTPLFFGPAGDFRLDPEFKTRYRVLDFPGGGVLVIGVHARLADFDEAIALGDPLVATLQVRP